MDDFEASETELFGGGLTTFESGATAGIVAIFLRDHGKGPMLEARLAVSEPEQARADHYSVSVGSYISVGGCQWRVDQIVQDETWPDPEQESRSVATRK
jgi:hypothetical protein